MEAHDTVEILICGAGAAGLTLAVDLARRGIAFRLIDKLPEPFAGSRGKGIQPRSLEVFEDLGVVDRLAAVGCSYPTVRIYKDDGSHDDSQSFAQAAPIAEEPYRSPLLVPQFLTETVLRERLAELGHAPDYGCELVAFEQDEAGVTARIADATGEQMLRCRYLVGGDGGRSFIRHALQLGFPGQTLGVRAIVVDLWLDGLSRDAWHRFNDGDMGRQISFCPLPHRDLFQLQAPFLPAGEADLSAAGVQSFIDERLPGRGLRVTGIAWSSAYSMNARLADRYRVGRVFLIGDAAHIHPPTGGQGLNTSVQDAYNLGWKLDAVLRGAPDALLDTYEEERRPIAAAMLGLSTELLERARQGDMRRGREVHQLDLSYAGSSLALPAPGRDSGIQPGDRAPDAPLLGAAGQARRLFDLLRGPHWTLVARGVEAAALPASSPGLRVHRVGFDGEFRDPEDHLGRLYGMADGDLLLIRPDGYVGALTGVAEIGRLADYLATMGIADPTQSDAP